MRQLQRRCVFCRRATPLALLLLGISTLGISLFGSAAHADPAPPPLVEYVFNETGTVATNSGAAGDTPAAQLTMRLNGKDADLHTPPGGGVSGQPSDRAFDNSQGGMALGGSIPKLGLIRFYTVSGWFKPGSGGKSFPLGGRIVDTLGGSGGFSLDWAGNGQLEITIPGNGQSVLSQGLYTDSGWTYFGVVVDLVRNTVEFYKAGTDADKPIQQVGDIGTFPQGPDTTFNSARLVIGNSADGRHPFPGVLDDIRVYSTTLTDNDLDFTRGHDLR